MGERYTQFVTVLELMRGEVFVRHWHGLLGNASLEKIGQPTLSRLENTPSWREPARMILSMIDLCCDSLPSVLARTVLDIDDIPDTVHDDRQAGSVAAAGRDN